MTMTLASYNTEISRFYDADGGVGQMSEADWKAGTHLGATRRTGGNQLLDTYTDLVIKHKLGCLTEQDLYRVQNFTKGCQNGNPKGVYDRSPPHHEQGRRRDVNAHDDYIGIACGSSIVMRLPFHFDIYEHGKSTGWVFDNGGGIQFTERHKPWFVVAYRLAAGDCDIGWFPTWQFRNIYMGKADRDSDSGRKLRWLICEMVRKTPCSPDIRGTVEGYMRSLNVLGGIKRVFARYYGAWHPFARYGAFT